MQTTKSDTLAPKAGRRAAAGFKTPRAAMSVARLRRDDWKEAKSLLNELAA